MAKYFFFCITLYVFCSPIQYQEYSNAENRLSRGENSLYRAQGFITKDIYQTQCSAPLNENRPSVELLIENCRLNTVRQWAELKIYFDALQEKPKDDLTVKQWPLEKVKQLQKHAAQKRYEWTPEQSAALLEVYKDLLPGYLIYESYENTHIGAYRVSRNNLLNAIIVTKIPFLEKGKSMLPGDKTIFK